MIIINCPHKTKNNLRMKCSDRKLPLAIKINRFRHSTYLRSQIKKWNNEQKRILHRGGIHQKIVCNVGFSRLFSIYYIISIICF